MLSEVCVDIVQRVNDSIASVQLPTASRRGRASFGGEARKRRAPANQRRQISAPI